MKLKYIDKQIFLFHLNSAISLDDLSRKISFNVSSKNIAQLNNKFNVDIRKILTDNLNIQRQKKKDEFLNKIVICDNCGKEYRNGDRLSNNKNHHHFCSDKCAKSYSAKFANTEEKKKQKSNTVKSQMKDVECECCKKSFKIQISSNRTLCDECFSDKIRSRTTPLSESDKRKIRRNIKLYRCRFCGAEYKKCKHPDICSHIQLIPRMSKYLGFNTDTLGSEQAYDEFERIKQYVYDLYWNQKMSIHMIKDKCGYKSTDGNFSKLLKHFIDFRDVSKAQQNLLEHCGGKLPTYQGHYKYKHGWYETWEGKKVYYRSSYELDYCKELDKNLIRYDMEDLKFKYYDSQRQSLRIAIPDFHITDHNLIVEIKSTFTFDKQNMLDKYVEYHNHGYKFKLILNHKEYSELEFLSL